MIEQRKGIGAAVGGKVYNVRDDALGVHLLALIDTEGNVKFLECLCCHQRGLKAAVVGNGGEVVAVLAVFGSNESRSFLTI